MELKVVFRNNKRAKLIGTLTLPQGSGPFPAALLVHGFMASKDLHFFPSLSEALSRKGFAVLRFDARACGESEGEYHPSYDELVEDILCAYDYLSQNPKIRGISLVGHSMGGTACIIAATTRDVERLVTLGAVAHPQQVLAHKQKEAQKVDDHYEFTIGTLTAKFKEDFYTDDTNPIEAIKHITCPVMIIHATTDTRVNIAEAEELFLTAPFPKSFKRIPSTDHNFKGVHEVLADTIAGYLQKER